MIQRFYKNILYVGIFIVLFTLQKTITFFGFALPLAFVFAMTIAIIDEKYETIIWGALIGLFIDISSGFTPGQNGLIYMFISLVLYYVSNNFYSKKWYIIGSFYLAGSVAYSIVMYLISLIIGNVGNIWYIFVIDGFLSTILGLCMYYIMVKIYEWIR